MDELEPFPAKMERAKDSLVELLAGAVEKCEATFDEKTGRFLHENGGWAVTNQDVIWSFAWLYVNKHPQNPYYRKDEILNLAARGGDALRDFQDTDGKVEFIKVDGSRWGKTYMPWSMFHWLEAFRSLKEFLPPECVENWQQGLSLAFKGIFKELQESEVHNIPAWKAMSLFRAGNVFNEPEWQKYAKEFMAKVVKAMNPDGYWPEGGGPSTLYNLVYVHSLGLYYWMSGDKSVIPALNAATEFHKRFTYPDGSGVETIDGRVKYHPEPSPLGLPGFLAAEKGKAYSAFRAKRFYAKCPDASRIPGLPHLASALNIWPQSAKPEDELIQESRDYSEVYRGHASLRKHEGFYTCLSGYVTSPETQLQIVNNRWIQDRSTFVSIWHNSCGLIIGGGNSKEQPLWGNFALWRGSWRIWCPVASQISSNKTEDKVLLDFAGPKCSISIKPFDEKQVKVTFAVTEFAETTKVQSALLVHLKDGMKIKCGNEEFVADPLSAKGLHLDPGQVIESEYWTIESSKEADLVYPGYPFDPYAIDGAAPPEQACAQLVFELTPDSAENEISVKALRMEYEEER